MAYKHGIGIIIDADCQSLDLLNTVNTYKDQIQISGQGIFFDEIEQSPRYSVKNDPDNKLIGVYMAINSTVITQIMAVIYPGGEGLIPTLRCIQFKEKDYGLDYLKSRLIQWMGENSCDSWEVVNYKGGKL